MKKKMKTFKRGGVHPPGNKELTSGKTVENAALPQVAVVPLSQHIGAPAECLVEPGDVVVEEQLLGRASGFVSAPVHAPIPGTVREIRSLYLPNGMKTNAVVIDLAGEFKRIGKPREKRDWKKFSREEMIQEIQDHGIVGMGGATFPTHVKFKIPPGKEVEYFIINAAECEPYLTADHRLMLERGEGIVESLRIIKNLLSPKYIVIGIEENKIDAAREMEELLAKSDLSDHQTEARVEVLKMLYPQGDEKNLVEAITGREVPSGKLPLETGCVISNLGTLYAVYEALVWDKPVVERYVTLSGRALKNPVTVKARIGTPIAQLMEEAGGLKEDPAKVVSGGPMTGFTLYDLTTPVIKGTSGVLALTAREIRSAPQTSCIQCGRCVASCPMGLNPTTLYKLIDHQQIEGAEGEGLMDCRECGSCGYACPARIPLIQGMRLGKRLLRMKKA